MNEFPYKFDDLLNPCIEAFHRLGGSATNAEVDEEVSRILQLTNEQASDIHRGNVTKLGYRMQWARNYLKRDHLLENSARGVWSLTEEGRATKSVDQRDLVRRVSALDRRKYQPVDEIDEGEDSSGIDDTDWQEALLDVLKSMPPDGFERLCQRLLRELGFTNVEVTGRSGDGGIDGFGNLKIGSVITFRIVFQSKRYKDTVSAAIVRDFRGAVQGRADKGLLITTGIFSRDAKAEAQRDGALAIDLMDGTELTERLKELGLGVSVELVEDVTINVQWFEKV